MSGYPHASSHLQAPSRNYFPIPQFAAFRYNPKVLHNVKQIMLNIFFLYLALVAIGTFGGSMVAHQPVNGQILGSNQASPQPTGTRQQGYESGRIPTYFAGSGKFFTGSGSYPGYVKLYKQVLVKNKINGAFSNFLANFSIFSGKKNQHKLPEEIYV